MELKTYYAAVEGFIAGSYRKAGDNLGQMTARQAKYLLLDGTITDKAPAAPAAAPAKRDK